MDESDSGSSSPGAQQVQAASEGRTGRLQPAVVCSYGQRLGFAYFDGEPAPEASELNSENETTHYFTIDNALVYLSWVTKAGQS